jgi:predicted transcriptional regulator
MATTITYKQAVELFANNNTAYVIAPSELAVRYEIIGTDFLLTPKTYENLIANNILKKVVEVVEVKGTVSNRTFTQEKVTYVSNIYVEPIPTIDTTNEINRLATILTELDFYSINENCYGSGMANLSEVDKVYDDTSCKKQSHATYVEFFKKQYTPYKEFDNVKSWIKANLRAMIEDANKELFSTYGGLTIFITFEKYKVRYWSTTQYQVKRIGKELRNIRVSKGIKQKDVCSTMQKDRISLIEYGHENPTLENLILITRGLGVKIKFE